jgi:uncharacterized protein (UPF0335 family)
LLDAKEDARKLNKAMKGIGTDEKALNEVIGNRTKAQLLEIAKEYQALFNTTLEKDLKGDTSGHYETLLCYLISSPSQVRVNLLKKATKGAGTTEKYLIDVLAPASNQEILDFYQLDPTIIANVINDISNSDFDKVIKILLKAKRSESKQVDENEAAKCAEQLYKAGEGKLGTDEASFINILTTHSVDFIKHASKIYESKHKHNIEKAIKGETSGHFEDILVALTKSKHEYFADRIWNATHGLGTDDHFVCFFFGILSRDDLHKVAQIFQERHSGVTLEKQILGDVSGHYGDLIKLLLKH